MSQHLHCDERGINLPCPDCATANRVAFARLAQQGRCGTCQKTLPKISAPVDMASSASFVALLGQSPLPIIIDFWAPWCGPCRMMAPEFEKASALAAGEAIFAKVNTDEQQEIASKFRIQGIPAFALIRGGKLVGQTSGFQPAAKLLEWVRQA